MNVNIAKFIESLIKPSYNYLRLWVTKRPVGARLAGHYHFFKYLWLNSKVTQNIFYLKECYQNTQNIKPLSKPILCSFWKKKQLKILTKHFVKVFYEMTTCPLRDDHLMVFLFKFDCNYIKIITVLRLFWFSTFLPKDSH